MNSHFQSSQSVEQRVAQHYTVDQLSDTVFSSLSKAGQDPHALAVDDLAVVDAFHIRGRESTRETLDLFQIEPGGRALDIGSGIGGTARYLARELDCHVTGIDLTPGYCKLATELSARAGMSEQTAFLHGSATALPFHDETFDLVWTEHVQMNIEDKCRFYQEAERVLAPGGKLVFNDIFAGLSEPLNFPVPWSSEAATSFLARPEQVKAILRNLGLQERAWVDSTDKSRIWFEQIRQRNDAQGPPTIGIHLLMGGTAKQKFVNALDGLKTNKIVTVQAAFTKPK